MIHTAVSRIAVKRSPKKTKMVTILIPRFLNDSLATVGAVVLDNAVRTVYEYIDYESTYTHVLNCNGTYLCVFEYLLFLAGSVVGWEWLSNQT